ncbi:MAG: ribosome small subunit-dependent GTPase A [Proteobacteria bacterium]|nr:ribosome small subunit-dependent GTPase A [Pseudomonadota bacterium]MBU1583383.1 ribosome small subunit-dependent GTPase A [Pseudomonadota bacterium]MBU2453977.1 ribosome small subunit-dependent GTPase A [Pseudomonadota bacterium]
MKLRNLGFNQWFETHTAELSMDGCNFARISAVDRGSYIIKDESREVPAELSGKLAFQIDSSVDLPCVEPIVILTKTDLITQDELVRKLAIINSVTKARVIALSNITGIGFHAFQQALYSGKTYCLLGSSGVGKTTLINRLLGQEAFETKAVSSTGEGTHTTSRRQLIVLSQGAMLIDTPGMRELGIVGVGDGVNIRFEELVAISKICQYANCSHQHEPGCAIRAAIEKGELDEDRYSNFIKLKKESEYYEMSYLDKRKKDKAFGRFIKSAKKHMKN